MFIRNRLAPPRLMPKRDNHEVTRHTSSDMERLAANGRVAAKRRKTGSTPLSDHDLRQLDEAYVGTLSQEQAQALLLL